MARAYGLISGDSHLDIPPERWVQYMPAEYRDRAPRTVRLMSGNDTQLIENRPPLGLGLAIWQRTPSSPCGSPTISNCE